MTEHNVLSPSSGVDNFLALAEKGQWEQFDEQVLAVCHDSEWVTWTQHGISDQRVDVRDLAISILEHTTSEVKLEQQQQLRNVMQEDENTHLKRKAAIALFRRGENDSEVIDRLKEAANDEELRDIVTKLLAPKGSIN